MYPLYPAAGTPGDSFLLPLYSFLFPLSSFLFPLNSFLFPLNSFLFPLSFFLFPPYSLLLPLAVYPLPTAHWQLPTGFSGLPSPVSGLQLYALRFAFTPLTSVLCSGGVPPGPFAHCLPALPRKTPPPAPLPAESRPAACFCSMQPAPVRTGLEFRPFPGGVLRHCIRLRW